MRRWRKQPNETGLSLIGQAPRGLDFADGDEILVCVRPLTASESRWKAVGWYWYGMGHNTSHEPVGTPDEAKAEATAWMKRKTA